MPPGTSTHLFGSSRLAVPFESPRNDLCGSTSIEMVSRYWTKQTGFAPALSLEELDKRTLLPNRGGTLQAEMISAARTNGLIVYKIAPKIEALIEELSAAHPVIVLVNRSFSWYPLWHYVTITGYHSDKKQIIAHFGDQPDEPIDLERFLEIWKRSNYWGVVMLPPESEPKTASLKTYLQSVYDMETTGLTDMAERGYLSAVRKWSKQVEPYLALGNLYLRRNRLSEAEQIYQKALALSPDSGMAVNNLSIVYARARDKTKALRLLDSFHTNDSTLQSMIEATRHEIIDGHYE